MIKIHDSGVNWNIPHDKSPVYNHCQVYFVCTFWGIAEGEDETGDECNEIRPFKENSKDHSWFTQ